MKSDERQAPAGVRTAPRRTHTPVLQSPSVRNRPDAIVLSTVALRYKALLAEAERSTATDASVSGALVGEKEAWGTRACCMDAELG